MAKMISGLFGGGDKSASREAEKSREQNRIAQERQLAAANQKDAEQAGKVRRAQPRGRRLFEDGPAGLAETLA